MERIRQAVEQARKDRLGVNAPVNRSVHSPVTRHGKSQAREVPSSSIEYTATRLVKVSDEVRDRNRLVAAVHDHPLQDTYRMLRTRVLQEMKANGWNTLAVTSPATGSGKTLTAINLAISLARDLSHTALLIDADLRRPSIHECFDYVPEFGLNDYLFNDVPLQDVLFHPDMDRLTVLPGREPITESAEMLASPKILSMLHEVRSRYSDRIVVLDVAPVLDVDDALALSPNVDCMLMVAEAGETNREDLRRSIELLDSIPIIGTVLNKVSKKIKSY